MRHYYMISSDTDGVILTTSNKLLTSIEAWLSTITEDENAVIEMHNSLCPDYPIDEYTLADIQNACKSDNDQQLITVTLENIMYYIVAVKDIE